MSLQDKYARNMRKLYENQYAVWPPIKTHELGDYGKLNGGVFLKYGNIRDLDVNVDLKIDATPDAMKAGASAGVVIKNDLSGDVATGLPAIPSASATITFNFQEIGDWVITTPGVFYDYIDKILVLQDSLRILYGKGVWDSSYRVVTGLYRMNEAKIFIADSDNLELTLKLSADLANPLVDLGKASVQASVVASSGAFVEHNPALNVTPMLEMMRLRTFWEWLRVPPHISLRAEDNPESYILGPDVIRDTVIP